MVTERELEPSEVHYGPGPPPELEHSHEFAYPARCIGSNFRWAWCRYMMNRLATDLRDNAPTGAESETKLVECYQDFIKREARRMHQRCPWAEEDDLAQRGTMGLLSAWRSPSRKPELPLAPFAITSIRNAMRGCPELKRGFDNAIALRVVRAHDALLLRGCFRPDENAIAEEANRRAAQDEHARPITSADVLRGLEMLSLLSPRTTEDLNEQGCGLAAAEPLGRVPSPAWFDAFTSALDSMLDDCGMSDDKAFVARYLFFGWPFPSDQGTGGRTLLDTKCTAQRLGKSTENVRQLKRRARETILARIRACLREAALEAVETCFWSVVVLLAGIEDEEDKVAEEALDDAESLLAEALAVLAPRAAQGKSPRWISELVHLALAEIRRAEDA